MVKIGSAKALFDFDIVAGLIIAVVVDWLWKYLAVKQFTVLATPIYQGFHYDDLLVLVTDGAVAMLTRGRIRKIFVYALWFNIAFEIYEWSVGIGGYSGEGLPLPS